MKKSVKKQSLLKPLAMQLGPVIDGLLQIERDALNLEVQYSKIPFKWTGAEKLLDACQQRIDLRFEALVGRAADGVADSGYVRQVLDAIGTLCRATGIPEETGRVRGEPVRIWVDDETLYNYIAPSRMESVKTSGTYVLAEKIELNPDGSLTPATERRLNARD